MKKIVSAALVASLVAGAAFAEVSIASNFRIRPVIADWHIGEPDTFTEYFSLNNKDNFNSTSAQGAADSIKFTASGDTAGIVTELNVGAEKDTTTTAGEIKAGNGYAVTVSNYYGFIKFGALTLTGGVADSRLANRVTNDQNNLSLIEQNWGANYSLATANGTTYTWALNKSNVKKNAFIGQKKLGVNGSSGAKAGKDSDNIMAIEATKVLSFVADYVVNDVADGKLQFWAALNQNQGDWTGSPANVNVGYAFRAAYTNKDFVVDADLHIRKDIIVAAAFFNPNMLKELKAVLGFTFASDKSGDEDATNWAIDARARYAVNDALAVGAYINFTMNDDGKATKSLTQTGIIDALLNVNYKVNDIVKVFAEGELVYFTESDVTDANGTQLAAQLGGLFTAGKGAEIDAAVRFTKALSLKDDKTSGTNIQIPVCMRVKL